MTQSDRVATRVLVRSRVFAAAEALGARLLTAFNHSRVHRAISRLAAWWQPASPAERRRASGLVLVTAAITHVVLVRMLGDYSSWIVFILPGIAAVAGALALISEAQPDRRA